MTRIPGKFLSPVVPPFIRMSRALVDSFSHGMVLSLMRSDLAAASTGAISRLDAAAGPMPPSSNGFVASAMTLPGSNAQVLPIPEHSSQAPYGLLKEKERGSSSGTLVPHSTHASLRE